MFLAEMRESNSENARRVLKSMFIDCPCVGKYVVKHDLRITLHSIAVGVYLSWISPDKVM